VDFVEPDMVMKICAPTVQRNAPSWGLGRISNRQANIRDYYYDDSAGAGTTAYVVDTGIDTAHPDFQGRALWGSNHVDGDDSDGHGHGTHVAGTIGGATYGVAKRTTLVAVKVLNARGQGNTGGIIAGIEWSVRDARGRGIATTTMNMSLGGTRSNALNRAAAAAVQAGMFVAVAAGNDGVSCQGISHPPFGSLERRLNAPCRYLQVLFRT
jgi:subtilisin family serine protease